MPRVACDPYLAELAVLDIVEVHPNGTLRVSEAFVDECIRALDADPSRLETVVQERIVARALMHGYAGVVDPDGLALALLELAAAGEPNPSA